MIELHPNDMKRKDGFSLSRLWKVLIHFMKERKVFSMDKILPPEGTRAHKRAFFCIPFPSCYDNIVVLKIALFITFNWL